VPGVLLVSVLQLRPCIAENGLYSGSKYLDIVIVHYPAAYIMWGSPHFIGRKPLPGGATDRARRIVILG
jgi:hypothetical protein